eukprot:1170749-Rhodomonas_salina.1
MLWGIAIPGVTGYIDSGAQVFFPGTGTRVPRYRVPAYLRCGGSGYPGTQVPYRQLSEVQVRSTISIIDSCC